jgi:hypothetical protein
MKRVDLVRHLMTHGCIFLRQGGNHTVVRNPANNRNSSDHGIGKFLSRLAYAFAANWVFPILSRNEHPIHGT